MTSHAFRERLLPTSILVAGIGAGPLLMHLLGGDPAHFAGIVHFAGVGISAVTAAAAAYALTVLGLRRQDGRTVLVGTAFSAMAALLGIHGLATPGFILDEGYGVISFTGAATLPVGGALFALSALPARRRPRDLRKLLLLQVGATAFVVGIGVLGMAFPEVLPRVPKPGGTIALTALGIGSVFYTLLAARALKTFLLTRRKTDLVVVIGIAWLLVALPPSLAMTYAQLGWWIGHFMELGGIIAIGTAVACDLLRGAQSRPLAGDLRVGEIVAQEEEFLGARVRALMVKLADKDEYTEEHTRRVALLAVRLGEELGLARGRLRALALGGLLHDMGKLRVPNAILNKPGKLDDHEFAVIRKHTLWGAELLHELGGFSDTVHRLVRDHHERLDGKGYPGALTHEQIPLDTRIMTVCDVFDALITTRVYREAWPVEQALALLRRETGEAFDARCVAALERVLRADGLLAAATPPDEQLEQLPAAA